MKIRKLITNVFLFSIVLATTLGLTGCEPLEGLNNGNSTKLPYEPREHYERPIMRSEDEMVATGITAEDVLAAYDNLAWTIAENTYSDDLIKHNYTVEENISAQFVKIGVYNHYWYDEELSTYDKNLCYAIDVGGYEIHDSATGKVVNSIANVYDINFYLSVVVVDEPLYIAEEKMGVYADQFEPIANTLSSGTFEVSFEYLDTLPRDLSEQYGVYYLSSAYKAFEITRSNIENATTDELYMYYDLYKSICSVTFEHTIPDIPTSSTEPSVVK